jgi:hypothetical protein
MPRFTLHRPKTLSPAEPAGAITREAQSASDYVPEGLRTDTRVQIIDEMPRLLLIECPEEAAAEWLAQMPGWKLERERRVKVPDPRPKLK